MSVTHNDDIHRHFNVSEISSDLGRKPDASSVLQVQLWRFVYAEHIVPESGFCCAAPGLGAEPRNLNSAGGYFV